MEGVTSVYRLISCLFRDFFIQIFTALNQFAALKNLAESISWFPSGFLSFHLHRYSPMALYSTPLTSPFFV